MVINHWVAINKAGASLDNVLLTANDSLLPETLYSGLQRNYPKFFKMDKLCKWAWLATEYLFTEANPPYAGYDKNRIAVALATSHGCIDVDKRYLESISLPSPSLFVYTLPNIMLGEICIRHGFKGEQSCTAGAAFDAPELYFIVDEFLKNKDMDACLCGWVELDGDTPDICLFWVTKSGGGLNGTPAILNELYKAGGRLQS